MGEEIAFKQIEKTSLIGNRIKKPDAPAKAMGKTRYINDMVLPQMLYGKILHAGRPHAEIINIDVSEAERLPGVHAVITAKDIPDLKLGFVKDNAPLKDKVRCERDEVAAVAAESEAIAAEALKLIKVDYRDLPAVLTAEEGLLPGAPVVQEKYPDNKSLNFTFKCGDLEAAEASSDIILDDTFKVHYVTHCCMGTSCAIADFDHNGKLTIYSQRNRSVFVVRGL